MARIERFEDIEAWKKARMLTLRIYEITSKGNLSRDFGLRDQLRRSAVSIMSNIAEGFERNSDAEFRRFLAYSKGSSGELRSQLYVALDVGFVSEESFNRFRDQCVEISRLISGLMTYLKT